MGATISFEHDPVQFQALKDSENALLKHYKAEEVVHETWLDLPSSDDLAGVSKLRCLKVGSTKGRPVLCIHGGGGMPTDFVPLFAHLAAKVDDDSVQFWFIERPGHGLSDPFDYWTVEKTVDKHSAALIDACRKVAGVEKIDIVANSMGGWVAYCFASMKPQHVRSFTWLGAPALYKGMPMPFDFRILGSWLGTQMMARPPPNHVPSKLLFETFNEDDDIVPDCYVEHYRAMMSLRNTSLSWNSMLRVIFSHMDLYEFDLEMLPKLSEKFDCNLITGVSDPFLPADKQKAIEQQFGKPAVVVGRGHLPWMGDAEGTAEAIFQAVS